MPLPQSVAAHQQQFTATQNALSQINARLELQQALLQRQAMEIQQLRQARQRTAGTFSSTSAEIWADTPVAPVATLLHAGAAASPKTKLDSFFEKVDVYGHVRVRQETDFERNNAGPGNNTRNRQRLRARLGMRYTPCDEWEAGLRMTTGDRKSALELADRSGAPLSYQDAGDGFDKFEFNLDRIYVKYSPHWLPNIWAEVGKFQLPMELNPITRGPVGSLGWDEAAQPEGVASVLTLADFLGFDTFKYSVGESAVLEFSDKDEASLFFTQVWLEKKISSCWTAEASLAFFGWTNLNPDGDTTLSFENNSGNAVVVVGPDPEDVVFASKFNILNPLVTLTYENDRDSLHPIQLVGEMFKNTTSFDPARDYGYAVGACYGSALTGREQWDWKIYYLWTELQQESVFTPIGQDDFQRATNFRGQMFGLAVYVFDNSDLHVWFLSDEPLDPINGSEKTEWRFRTDITFRF